MRLDNIPLMGGQLAVEVEGEVVRALKVPDGLTIVVRPAVADALSAGAVSCAASNSAKSPSGSVHQRASRMPARVELALDLLRG